MALVYFHLQHLPSSLFQNYNKSRIHSYRGAKDVMMTLDSAVIFKGEIARACGGVEGGTEAFGDVSIIDSAVIFKGEIARACGGVEGGTEAFGDVSMKALLTLCSLGFFYAFLLTADFFQKSIFDKFFKVYHQSVKQFGS